MWTQNSEAKVSLFAMQAMQNLFINLENLPQKGMLNNNFKDILSYCINKILSKEFIQGGYLTGAQDAVNDITQHCDYKNLKQILTDFCDQILALLND